jgi:hypothetical protein
MYWQGDGNGKSLQETKLKQNKSNNNNKKNNTKNNI